MKTITLCTVAILTLLIAIGCFNQILDEGTPSITIFRFDKENNAGFTTDVLAEIDQGTREITAVLPYGSSA